MDENDLVPNFEPHRYLSAPWRMQYLRDGLRSSECIFCSKIEAGDDEANLVLWRGPSVFAMMNLYPYATGHIMIAPYAHEPSPETVDPEIMAELGTTIAPCMRALRRVLSCQGFNTGINTGAAAGAGVADHMHLHIVPRWGGDANFMPVIAGTTVMPEALSVTYGRIRAELLNELGEGYRPGSHRT
jgi:ATP adenylyltransferase